MVLQTAAQFERFGETALTGDAVSLALVRELGPAITAIVVAGRNASGIASELGSMVVTEQVDAMRALGTDPIRKLVTPRVVARYWCCRCLSPWPISSDWSADSSSRISRFASARFSSGRAH